MGKLIFRYTDELVRQQEIDSDADDMDMNEFKVIIL